MMLALSGLRHRLANRRVRRRSWRTRANLQRPGLTRSGGAYPNSSAWLTPRKNPLHRSSPFASSDLWLSRGAIFISHHVWLDANFGAGRNPRLYAQNGLLAIQRGRPQGETQASEIAKPGGIAEAAVRSRGPSRGGMAPPMRDPSPSRLRPMPSHRFRHTLRRKGSVARSCGKISGNRAQRLRRQLRQLHSRVSNSSTEWRVPQLSRRGRRSFQKRHAILAATRSPTAEVE